MILDLRKSIQHELTESQSVGADGVIHHFRRIQVQQWCPGNRIEALEQEYHCHITVDDALRGRLAILCVDLAQATDDKQAYDK